MAAQPIPDGFHTITPYLVVQEVDKLIDFLKKAFGAKERLRHKRPDGTTGHAEVTIGDSILMMGGAGGLREGHACNHLHVRQPCR